MRTGTKAALAGGALSALALPLVAAGRLRGRRERIQDEPLRQPSYWQLTGPELPSFPRLSERIEVDVAVVGGGFTGLAAAYYLKRHAPEASVALLEAQTLGSGASTRNSGAVGRQLRGQESNDATRRGYELLRAFASEQGDDFDLAEDIPVLRLHRRRGALERPDLAGAELARQIGSDFYQEAEASTTTSIHPGKLIASLTRACQERGVQIFEHSPVTRISREGGRPLLVTTGGHVHAGDVILATNAYTPLLGIANRELLVMHHRVIVTRPLDEHEWERSGLERWPIRLEDGTYFTHTVRATPDRRFFYRHVLGHRPLEAVTWRVEERDVEAGRRELLRRYPWLEGVEVEYAWHGVTARTRDLWPVVGEVEPRVFIAAGYNGSGVMPSHFFGYLLARRILGHHDADLDQLERPPAAHPAWPPELLRHSLFQGALRYRRLLDGRGPLFGGR